MIDLIKAHSYGNDFLFTPAGPIAVDRRAAWATRDSSRDSASQVETARRRHGIKR